MRARKGDRTYSTASTKSGHWKTSFLHGWLRVRSALQLGHRLFEGFDRLGPAFLRQLVPVDDQCQAVLVAADDAPLVREITDRMSDAFEGLIGMEGTITARAMMNSAKMASPAATKIPTFNS